ncbi:hypothetical protein GCM10010260_71770 [Streptomyces filipinensis]|uniref:PPM-type phosphatase domain-containing protein n=1 Tax=Streptomyces filipinensis TaxID=66887 RepID=A0A918MFJ0_9ACTN|nr:SpoIIE family protein phosphatase [Streptomyces filipinensis]GGV21095.1 hypothetical protein GCM10010260_71770 [Streptomyces filipinensis]
MLKTPVGVPLGVNDPCGAGVPFRQATQPVPPGSTLAIYTDGLVERPGTAIEAQIDTLARTLDSALKGIRADQESLDRTADLLIKTLLPATATHDDDVTLLLIGLPMPKGSNPVPDCRDAGPLNW